MTEGAENSIDETICVFIVPDYKVNKESMSNLAWMNKFLCKLSDYINAECKNVHLMIPKRTDQSFLEISYIEKQDDRPLISNEEFTSDKYHLPDFTSAIDESIRLCYFSGQDRKDIILLLSDYHKTHTYEDFRMEFAVPFVQVTANDLNGMDVVDYQIDPSILMKKIKENIKIIDRWNEMAPAGAIITPYDNFPDKYDSNDYIL